MFSYPCNKWCSGPISLIELYKMFEVCDMQRASVGCKVPIPTSLNVCV